MSRRALHFVSGVAVLFASVLYVHMFYHVVFVAHHFSITAGVMASMILAALAGVFCFVGAYLLLTGGRVSNP
jgi:hypothetical protein